MTRRRKSDGRRIKLYLSLIRRVRGKSLLEALYRLQSGACAYDGNSCALLLPQAINLYSCRILRDQQLRFATIDHVTPRHLGGANTFQNLVMASSLRNGQKGCLEPIGFWRPAIRHSSAEVAKMIKLVDEARWLLAQKYAEDRRLNKQDVLNKLISRELNNLSSGFDFKFYEDPLPMVA